VLEHGLQKVVNFTGVTEVVYATRGCHHVKKLLDVQLNTCSEKTRKKSGGERMATIGGGKLAQRVGKSQ